MCYPLENALKAARWYAEGPSMLDYSGLSFQHIRYFITIAEKGSMSQAAEILHATPSALSQKIAQLEEIIDIKLFYRSRQRLYLTDAGNRLLPEFKDTMLRLFNVLDSEWERREGKQALAIGFTTYYEETADVILDEFRKKYPNLDFSVEFLRRDLLQINFLDKKIDVIMIFDFEKLHQKKGVISQAISKHQIGCYMNSALPLSRKEELSWKDLDGMECVLPEYQKNSHFLDDILKKFNEENIKISVQFHDGDIRTINKIIMHNKFITFARHRTLSDGRLKSFLMPDLEYQVILAYHADANKEIIKYAKELYNIICKYQ
jgi:DNA-binding transcriptional LysR family regulator